MSVHMIGPGHAPILLADLDRHTDGYGKHVSYSQASKGCGLAVRGHREGWAIGARAISLAYGTAVHEGIEHYIKTGDVGAGVELAKTYLHEAEAKAGKGDEPPLRWDDPPRIAKTGQVYRGDEARIPDMKVAELGASLQIRSWVERFGSIGAVRLDDIELDIQVPLDGEFEGWKVKCRLDIPTDEGGMVDIKTSSKSWKDEEADSKLDQAHLEHLAFEHHYGEPASYLTFHVGLKGTPNWEVFDVPYDAEAIERVVEYRVKPTIRTILAGAYVPNTAGWWHGPKCEFWSSCPLGEKARGAGWRVA